MCLPMYDKVCQSQFSFIFSFKLLSFSKTIDNITLLILSRLAIVDSLYSVGLTLSWEVLYLYVYRFINCYTICIFFYIDNWKAVRVHSFLQWLSSFLVLIPVVVAMADDIKSLLMFRYFRSWLVLKFVLNLTGPCVVLIFWLIIELESSQRLRASLCPS